MFLLPLVSSLLTITVSQTHTGGIVAQDSDIGEFDDIFYGGDNANNYVDYNLVHHYNSYQEFDYQHLPLTGDFTIKQSLTAYSALYNSNLNTWIPTRIQYPIFTIELDYDNDYQEDLDGGTSTFLFYGATSQDMSNYFVYGTVTIWGSLLSNPNSYSELREFDFYYDAVKQNTLIQTINVNFDFEEHWNTFHDTYHYYPNSYQIEYDYYIGILSPSYLTTSEDISNAFDNGYATGVQQTTDTLTAQFETELTQAVNQASSTAYQEGLIAGQQYDGLLPTIFTGVLDIALLPVNIFLGMLNFEIFGINIGGFVSSLLTLTIVIMLIKVITGKNGADKE